MTDEPTVSPQDGAAQEPVPGHDQLAKILRYYTQDQFIADYSNDTVRVTRELLCRSATELERLQSVSASILRYGNDLRRNSSGGDDYPWETMRAVANELDRLLGAGAQSQEESGPKT